MSSAPALTQRRIFGFWGPLALTWLMMSVEGPFLAAVIARLARPTANLAAYGVAFAFAMLLESPIILVMSASTALVEDRETLQKLRAFTYALNGLITAAMALLLVPPVFRGITEGLIGLPPEVAELTHGACLLLLPWPAAIGYRRFYQGILIRSGLTRRVAYGTVVRLTAMGGVGLLGAFVFRLDGALVGASSLASGVCGEAVASRLMASGAVRSLLALERSPARERSAEPFTYGFIWRFYYPLALTSMLALGINPLVTFFLGRSRMALESLAVMPVVTSLVFLFGSGGLAFQETAIALVGRRWEGYGALRRYGLTLAGAAAACLAVLAFTPARALWLVDLSGLKPTLEAVAVAPIQILAVMPLFTWLLSFQRALLVAARRTSGLTWATAIEVAGVTLGLAVGIRGLSLVGATAAAIALLTGRIASVLFLAPHVAGARRAVVSPP
jgi:hypothetical protein